MADQDHGGDVRKLSLIEDPSDLIPGLDVVLMPCGCCGSSHESKLGSEWIVAPNGYPGLELQPPPSCIGLPMLCTALAVRNRRVYRVVEATENEIRTKSMVSV